MRDASLKSLYLNVRLVEDISDALTEAEIGSLQEYLDYLIRPADWPTELAIYVHNVRIDPQTRRLSDYKLNDTLLKIGNKYPEFYDAGQTLVHGNFDQIAKLYDLAYRDIVSYGLPENHTYGIPIQEFFMYKFPFIQNVSLHNEAGTERSSLLDSLIKRFLLECGPLVSLKISSTGFTSGDFMKLVNRPSVQSLACLHIFEPKNKGRQLKNFIFLQKLRYLQNFRTNLAVAKQVNLIGSMLDSSRASGKLSAYFSLSCSRTLSHRP